MSYLKVELRSHLKRSFDGCYGFDLTRHCAACWTRLGRFWNRGFSCENCQKKVCKSCRHFVEQKNWMCLLCYKRKCCREKSGGIQSLSYSPGKRRRTVWYSDDILDILPIKTSTNRRNSFAGETIFERGKAKHENNIGNFENESDINAKQLDQRFSTTDAEKSLQRWRRLEEEEKKLEDKLKSLEYSLRHTSFLIKQGRRKRRINIHISQNSLFINATDDNRCCNNSCMAPSEKLTLLSNKELLDSFGIINELPQEIHESSRGVPDIQLDSDSLNEITLAGCKRRCNNFYVGRLSVRGTRNFRKNKHNNCNDKSELFMLLPNHKWKSFSVPSVYTAVEYEDADFWNVGFVQSRVQKLEKDLATSFDNLYCLRNYDFEVQSLCSLEMERILPDAEDYRITYLSSLDTSLESSLEYIDDNMNDLGMKTLDIKDFRNSRWMEASHLSYEVGNDFKHNKNDELVDDFSLNSSEEGNDSSDEDELYFGCSAEDCDRYSTNSSYQYFDQNVIKVNNLFKSHNCGQSSIISRVDFQTYEKFEDEYFKEQPLITYGKICQINKQNETLEINEVKSNSYNDPEEMIETLPIIRTNVKNKSKTMSVFHPNLNFRLELAFYRNCAVFPKNNNIKERDLELDRLIHRNKKCIFCEKRHVRCVGESIKFNYVSTIIEEIYHFENLSTPFSEIYDITYGKKFPRILLKEKSMDIPKNEVNYFGYKLKDRISKFESPLKTSFNWSTVHSHCNHAMKSENDTIFPSNENKEILNSGGAFCNFIDFSCKKLNENQLNHFHVKNKDYLWIQKEKTANEIMSEEKYRNQNSLFNIISLWETEPHRSESNETYESGVFPARRHNHDFTTSLTGRTTFVECFQQTHGQNRIVSDQCVTHLPSGSVLLLTVPAVQRVTKRESSPTENKSTVLQVSAISVDRTCQCCSIKFSKCDFPFFKKYSSVLDYIAVVSVVPVDYNPKDYVFKNLSLASALLIVDNSCDNLDLCNGASTRYTVFQRIMATDDPRSVSRALRSEGKNVSKLRRVFDSSLSGTEIPSHMEDNSLGKLRDRRTIVFSENMSKKQDQTLNTFQSNSYGDRNVNNGIHCSVSSAHKNSSNEQVRDSHLSSEIQNSNDSQCEIPHRKVTNDSLWESIDTNNRNGLWTSSNNTYCSTDKTELLSSSSCTDELNSLIAVSRTELSNLREPSISEKSKLENYFTSFEDIKSRNVPVTNETQDDQLFHSTLPPLYNCDMNEINFDDDDVGISDGSSDEEMRGDFNLTSTNYLPAYALHTIIEESCEESERDSRTATPTNNAETSKLERYFSWDIINDRELSKEKKDDDDSTTYSDSLSEGSVVDDPSQLVSSRLEKYFMSGLVDDQNCFYPDEVEFSEDLPVSDFEDDSTHQKISRSALLSSLETILDDQTSTQESHDNDKLKVVIPVNILDPVNETKQSNTQSTFVCDKNESHHTQDDFYRNSSVTNTESEETLYLNDSKSCDEFEKHNELSTEMTEVKCSDSSDLPKNCDLLSHETVKSDLSISKPISSKQQISIDIQSVIQKLVSHFTATEGNMENDYTSAWQILETEVERLLNTLSPSALEHNCSSMLDSNNSDYGSDTVECATDDDEDSKSRTFSKYTCTDMKMQPENDLTAFNISDETVGIWKRLIQSLQKDNVTLAKSKASDPNAEARLYIKNQIVMLMHTVTIADSNATDTERPAELFFNRENDSTDSSNEKDQYLELNEAFNINVSNSDKLAHLSEENISVSKPESSDEGISSTDSSENLHTTTIIVDHTTLPNEGFPEEHRTKLTLEHKESSSPMTDNDLYSAQESLLPPENFSSTDVNDSYRENETPEEKRVDISEINRTMLDTSKNITENLECQSKDVLEPMEERTTLLQKEFESSQSLQSPKTSMPSYVSYDDSILNTSSQVVEVPNFKSLKRTVKKFPPPSSSLSKSTNNILQSYSSPETKFSTLQLKLKKSKPSASPSRQFTSLFSTPSVFKRITGSKTNEHPNAESAIPQKYLKKYARSVSENESLFGTISMPHLNSCKPGDSYSALGLYSENDQDSSLALDDESDVRGHFSGSQSVLSLGSRCISMNSVYSYHYGHVSVSGDVLFGLNYNQKSQMMEVFVKQCRSLAAIDSKNNKSNPYVKVYLLPDKTRSGKRKTKTKKSTLNPVFNELLRFPVSKNELESRILWLSVWNNDLFGKNDFLGEISLPLGYRLLDSPTLRWYPLQERAESLTSPLNYQGELFIALKYVPRDLSLESRFRPAPVISLRGALHVLVKEARNISTNKSSGALDAFCKSYLLPDKSKSSKQKTPIVKKSRHPKWYYTVIYEDLSIDELRERSLELTIWDHDKITSNEFLGGVRLNIGSNLYHGVPVEWMDARRDESSLWQAMLDSPNMWVDGCLPLRPTLHSHHY